MNPQGRHRRLAGILAIAAVAPACMAAAPVRNAQPALAVACTTVPAASAPAAATGSQRPQWDLPSVPGKLYGIAARSSGSAVAVGLAAPHSRALVALWNGATWRTLSNQALPATSELYGAALFPGGAWAVGDKNTAEHGRDFYPLMVRVTGTRVQQVPLPRTADGSALNKVAATSATNAWAVGLTPRGALILHWNGKAWTRPQLPATVRREASQVDDVAATSSTNAWAVMNTRTGRLPLIEHWNGRRWGNVAAPHIGTGYDLAGVAATSARNVWAAGSGVILHWNGLRWSCARTPSNLFAISASSANNAWAVGGNASQAVTMHWNGHTWKQVTTPQPSGYDFLLGVVAIPHSGHAFAVGQADTQTLMLHWNGTAWH